MSDHHILSETLDVTATILLFAAACTVGTLCTDLLGDESYLFSLPAISTVTGGELIWKKVKHKLPHSAVS